ncbi:MAG: carbamoyl-phosphate synthase large subunit [Bacillota bacterium]|nr:MAG: carbamoyl-phosphate synthase large subunit [Bacillota bacterium]
MPKNPNIKKVLVIGSGPIIIGQAAEFDYSGTQACRTLKEQGIQVVLANNNPATIMTDIGMAEAIYMDPLTLPYIEEIIRIERPDSLLPTLGGQMGLNMARELVRAGVLATYNVQLLGTPLAAIEQAEDRSEFREAMLLIGQPVPDSAIAYTVAEALEVAVRIGYPLIVRPAFTMGGTGGGHAATPAALATIAEQGLRHSPVAQLLIEKSIAGWKEIEYEVIRDSHGNAITICNMENIDPVGIHTGDSIVVAPCQTLSDREHQMLRSAALKIVGYLNIEGGCNVQFALHPTSMEYNVIEVNPRVSRSSALASKATGYPIAKVATLVSLGLRLDEIINAVTGTSACFEPALDYIVVKIPRWPFDKFAQAERSLGSQMKATGEVMAIGRNFASALHKAIRSLELGLDSLRMARLQPLSTEDLWTLLRRPDDERLFVIYDLLRRGVSPQELHAQSWIDMFFLEKLWELVQVERDLRTFILKSESLRYAKMLGFSDLNIAELTNTTDAFVANLREQHGIQPTYKMVDTCAGEFLASTPYFYSSYEQEDEAEQLVQEKVVVIGSGPIRIGQGVEFDYCSVRASLALQEEGLASIVINNNPETVSTDFDTSSRLYFEPLTAEDVLAVLKKEQPSSVVVQFGGQTAVNLARTVEEAGYKILGTSAEAMDYCEDRERFEEILTELDIPRPLGFTAKSIEDARDCALKLGFPVIVRPSYVLGGRSMAIIESEDRLLHYLSEAVKVMPNHPVLIDRYCLGLELEVDVLCDGHDVFIPGIMEHIERAGVHSGDSIAVYPAPHVTTEIAGLIVEYCQRLVRRLGIVGVMNIQFVLYAGKLLILEVNPRSSRTVPFISKITGIPLINWAIKLMLGKRLMDIGISPGLAPNKPYFAVKMPVFSFQKMTGIETCLNPEMKSTGETIGLAETLPEALRKGFMGSIKWAKQPGTVVLTVADRDKIAILPAAQNLQALGYKVAATQGTAKFLRANGLEVEIVQKLGGGHPDTLDLIRKEAVQLIVNTPTQGQSPLRDGFRIRRAAAEFNVPCLTSTDTLNAFVTAVGSDSTPIPFKLRP